MKLFKKLFPCRFNNPLCEDNPGGCRCGVIGTAAAIITAGALAAGGVTAAAAISSSAQKKAAASAQSFAEQQQAAATAEQRRLEEKFGLTPGELAREQRLLGIPTGEEAVGISQGAEAKQQTTLEKRAGMSGEELLKEVGPQTRALLEQVAARQGKTGEELFREEGAIPKALADQILSDVQDPDKAFESTLAPELELSRQMVNAEANKRGVFGGLPEGGIRFEQLGRTGVDLAIKSAQARMANRQLALSNAMAVIQNEANLSAGARADAATVGERALTSSERARAEYAQFLQDEQNQSATAKGRAASAGIGAANILQPQVDKSYQNMIDIAGAKGGIISPAEAGLSAIGKIGADVAFAQLNKAPATTTPTDLSGFRQAGADYDPYAELAGFTGSDVIARKRQSFARY